MNRIFSSKFDPEGFGEIPWTDFLNAMDQPEFRERVNTGKRQILLEKSRTATTPAITFQDFVNVVSVLQDNLQMRNIKMISQITSLF